MRDSGKELVVIDSDELVKKCRSINRADISHYIGQINHYATKTMPEYRMRIERGLGTDRGAKPKTDRYTIEYFNQFSMAHQIDTSISDLLPEAKEVANGLLQIERIRHAYETCLRLSFAKLESATRSWDEREFRIK